MSSREGERGTGREREREQAWEEKGKDWGRERRKESGEIGDRV